MRCSADAEILQLAKEDFDVGLLPTRTRTLTLTLTLSLSLSLSLTLTQSPTRSAPPRCGPAPVTYRVLSRKGSNPGEGWG